MSRTLRTLSEAPATSRRKFEAPYLAEYVLPRHRLTCVIERHLGKERPTGDVALISAPAGYGKTTVLAQWALTAGMPVMWYHLDAADDDPAVFIQGIVRALRTQLPRGQWDVKALLAGIQGGALSPLDVQRSGEILIRDIRRHVRRPMTLILTGVDHVRASSAISLLLTKLLARPLDELRIALEFREVPSISLSSLLSSNRVAAIGPEDLLLTEEEAEAILTRVGMNLNDTERRDVRTLCKGWVTGVLLATGALWPSSLASRMSDHLNREAVFSYLADEVIDRLPTDLLDFATRASILPHMTAPLCASFLGVSNAREQLIALERRTGFVTHVGRRPQEPVYTFVPLLRDALLSRLEREAGDSEVLVAQQIRAGQILEEAGDFEEAVQQYVGAREFGRLVQLIEARRGLLQRVGQGATLARWITLIPLEVLDHYPHLQVLLAEQYRIAGATADALEVIQRVCRRHTPDTDTDTRDAELSPLLAAQALLVRADVRYIQGHYEAAKDDCEQALRLAPDNVDELHIKARLILAACLNHLSGPQVASDCLHGVDERCVRVRDLCALGRLHYVRSNLALAQGAYEKAEHAAMSGLLAAQEANDEIRAMMCRLNLGGIRQYLGRPEAAHKDLEAALAQAESASHLQGQGYALVNLADLKLTVGDYTSACELYKRAQTIERHLHDQRLRTCIAAGMSCALAQLGELEAALVLVSQARDGTSQEQHGLDWTLATTALGFVLYEYGDWERAYEELRSVSAFARAHGHMAEFARAQLILAAVELKRMRNAEANVALRIALEAAAEGDGTPASLLDARHLPALWPLLDRLNHPLATTLLMQLAIERENGAGKASPDPETDAEAQDGIVLRIFGLGEVRILVGTERITRWPRPRMRELLLFLLDRGDAVRTDVILDAIWPEKEHEAAEEEFRKTRFELKKALGQQWIEREDGRWRVTLECWFDVHEFERLAAEGERLIAEGQTEAAVLALRQALTYWTGPYLDEIYSDWTSPRREAVRQRYIRTLRRLAALEVELRQFENAAQLYYRILDNEPTNEVAHRGLMLYFASRGEPSQAIAQFHRCEDILRSELGAAPGRQTIALYQSIRAKMQSNSPH